MTPSSATKIIYSTALLLASLAIWTLLYTAQFLDYDDNYGQLLSAFFLSVCAALVLAVVWFKMRPLIKATRWQTMMYLLIASPLTIALVVINYPVVFGHALKN
jgi:cytochrome bd-type quinol oxidase subunit 2